MGDFAISNGIHIILYKGGYKETFWLILIGGFIVFKHMFLFQTNWMIVLN
jgi:hypothetical protein